MMAGMDDRATPVLPSRNYDLTEVFYRKLGSERVFRADSCLVIPRGTLKLIFALVPETDPLKTASRCAIDMNHVRMLQAQCLAAGMPSSGPMRVSEVVREPWGPLGFYFVDLDGNLMRCWEDDSAK